MTDEINSCNLRISLIIPTIFPIAYRPKLVLGDVVKPIALYFYYMCHDGFGDAECFRVVRYNLRLYITAKLSFHSGFLADNSDLSRYRRYPGLVV